MADAIRIAAISGSLRKASVNTRLLRTMQQLAPDGVTVDVHTLHGIPLYDGDLEAEGTPAAVTAMREVLMAADGVLIASPEYNHSIPGVLKNAIDWLSRTRPNPFAGRPTAILGGSPGRLGTSRMQPHLRQVLVSQDAALLNKPDVFVGGAFQIMDDDGVTDARTRDFLKTQLDALIARIRDHRILAAAPQEAR